MRQTSWKEPGVSFRRKGRLLKGLGIGAGLAVWTAFAVVWTLEANEELVDIGRGKRPAVASDDLGHTIVAWESSDSKALVQPMTMGVFLGAPLRMSSSGGAEGNVAAAHLSGNEFAVAWEHATETGTGIRGRLLKVEDGHLRSPARMGITVGAPFQVTSNGSAPALGADDDGDFVVAWTASVRPSSSAGEAGYGYRHFAVGFRMGSTVGAPFRLGKPGPPTPPTLAVKPDGDFLVAWQDAAGNIRGSVVDAAGALVRDNVRISDRGRGRQSSPSAAAPLDGTFVVVWERRHSMRERWVVGRRLACDGSLLGDELQISLSPSRIATLPDVAADAWGRMLVTWTSRGAGTGERSVLARPLELGGGAAGDEVMLAQPGAMVSRVQATSTEDDFVVVWESRPKAISGRFVKVPAP